MKLFQLTKTLTPTIDKARLSQIRNPQPTHLFITPTISKKKTRSKTPAKSAKQNYDIIQRYERGGETKYDPPNLGLGKNEKKKDTKKEKPTLWENVIITAD